MRLGSARILLRALLLCGCATGQKLEGVPEGCGRGHYWSRSAEACVPAPGPQATAGETGGLSRKEGRALDREA